ncbi:hypothetical protein BBJ28_00025369 [Nothophytophthora sp. Chile5]|nr:hypothetical protein BBJ28_00025369 [Nothophytophthora sp. Chile5]
MSAQSLFDLIADTLSRYNKPWESVAFMVGDNCSVNRYIGRREGAIPLIGCASHRFNLAVRDFLKDDEPLMGKIQTLMLKLRTIKGRALLRRMMKLSPALRNDTRWSRSFEMLKRYVVLEPLIGSLGHGVLEEYDIQPLLLRRSENDRARALLNDLRNFEGVTKTLQQSNLTLSDAFKHRKVTKRAGYMDVLFVPPTSNECKRFFSSVKLVYSDLHKSMDIATLEKVMFLRYNADFWDVYTVERVRSAMSSRNTYGRQAQAHRGGASYALAQMSMAWAVSNENVSTVLVGASRPSQLEENLKSLDFVSKITPEVKAKIDAIVNFVPTVPTLDSMAFLRGRHL